MADRLHLVGLTSPPSAGTLQVALHEQHGVAAEAFGATRLRGGVVELDLDHAAGRSVVTPCPLLLPDGARGVLRRSTDLPSAAAVWLLHLPGAAPSAGELATALHGAGIHGEDVGLIRKTDAGITVELSSWRHREADLPKTLFDRPTVVEKKKPEPGLKSHGRKGDRASDALRQVVEAGSVSPLHLQAAIRRAVDQARGDEPLSEAVARLRGAGFATESAPIPTRDAGLLLLTLALAPRKTRRQVLAAFRSIPFPTAEERTASTLLEGLEAEADGQLAPTHPFAVRLSKLAEAEGISTRAGGTFVPGARKSGLRLSGPREASEGDSLLGQWLAVADSVARGDGLPDDAWAALDANVRREADGSGLGLADWDRLRDLVAAEAVGTATPIPVPLDSLHPSSARFLPALLRRIDDATAAGRFSEATTLATQGIEVLPDSAELGRRHIRLTRRLDHLNADPVTMVHAAEKLFRDGKRDQAANTFELSEVAPGTPAADLAARRLVEMGRPRAAARYLADSTPQGVRASVLSGVERWNEAVEAWGLGQGALLGLCGAPTWLDAAAKGLLSSAHRCLVEGDLASAKGRISGELGDRITALLADPLRTRPFPMDAPVGPTPLTVFFATPDPRAPLLAAADLLDHGQDVRPYVAVLRRSVKETISSDWDSGTTVAAARIATATGDRAFVDAIDTDLLLAHLDSDDEVLASAAETLLAMPTKVTKAGTRLDHAPARRILRAHEMFAEEKLTEATAIALSVFRRGTPGGSRAQAAAVLALAGSDEALVTALGAPRSDVGKLRQCFDILVGLAETLAEEVPLSTELAAALTALKGMPVRVELGRQRLLTPP